MNFIPDSDKWTLEEIINAFFSQQGSANRDLGDLYYSRASVNIAMLAFLEANLLPSRGDKRPQSVD